jgi:hypothetical protein
MKRFAYFFFVSLLFSFLGCKKDLFSNPDIHSEAKQEQLVDDKTIYEFLNSVIVTDSSYKYSNTVVGSIGSLWLEKSDSLQLLKADTIFSEEDAHFIFKQARMKHFYNVDRNELCQGKNVIYLDEKIVFGDEGSKYWSELRKKYGSMYIMTIPVFSLDKNTAMISTSHQCGSQCGTGATYVYKKYNNHWRLIATWNKWVS